MNTLFLYQKLIANTKIPFVLMQIERLLIKKIVPLNLFQSKVSVSDLDTWVVLKKTIIGTQCVGTRCVLPVI